MKTEPKNGWGMATGVLLAGGQSRRFGSPKALLFSDELLARLDRWCDSVLVSANDPSLFAGKGRHIIPDVIAGRGPLEGIAAAMAHSRSPWLLVLSCDMPLVNRTAQTLLQEPRGESTRLICYEDPGRIYPFPGLYHRDLLETLSLRLSNGSVKVTEFISSLSPESKMILPLEPELLSFQKEFLNMNTRADLELLRNVIR